MPPIAAYDEMPARTDVAIVGSGLGALSAARILGRHGMSVTVLDGREPGYGAGTRNHGMVGGGLKIPADTDQALGKERADWIRRGAHDSFTEFKQIIADEKLDVDYTNSGRLTAAHTPAAYKYSGAARRGTATQLRVHDSHAAARGAAFGDRQQLLSRRAARRKNRAVFSPPNFTVPIGDWRSRLAPVSSAMPRCVPSRGGMGRLSVRTSKGDLRADKVFVSTNAYTGSISPKFCPFVRRRIVPVTAYIATTEELPPDLAQQNSANQPYVRRHQALAVCIPTFAGRQAHDVQWKSEVAGYRRASGNAGAAWIHEFGLAGAERLSHHPHMEGPGLLHLRPAAPYGGD